MSLKSILEKQAEKKPQKKLGSLMFTGSSLILSIAVLLTGVSIAWFCLRNDVEGSTNTFAVRTPTNLLISDDPDSFASVGSDFPDYFTVTFTGDAEELNPVTYDEASAPYHLRRVTVETEEALDPADGLTHRDGEELAYEAVPNGSTDCFKEYTVYLATFGGSLENVELLVSLTDASAEAVTSNDSRNAFSVDFYLGETYCGTKNLAGLNSRGTFDSNGLLRISLPDNKIPNITDGYLTLTLRCYFDGALTHTEDSETVAYVRSSSCSTEDVNVTAFFEAVELPAT